MAKAYSQRCLVLKKTKLGETDLIITMLAEEGRQVRAVARGARRPGSRFGARLEPFSVVDLLLHPGRSLETITEARCVETNADCRTDLEHTTACDVIAEFLDKVTRDGLVGNRMFALTQTAYRTIGEQDGSDAPLFVAAHLLKAMSMLGYRPAIHECALCGEPVAFATYFNPSAGGSLCQDCAPDVHTPGDVDPLIVDWVDLLLHSTFAELVEVDGAPVFELLDFCIVWMREHLTVELKSMVFMRSLL